MPTDPTNATARAVFTQSLDAVRDQAARIPQADLVPIRVDVATAVLTALGAAPEIRAQRPALVALFGEAEASAVDQLEAIARAAGQAHAEHLAVTGVDLEPLAQEVIEMRTRLVTDAESLVQRKVLGPKAVANLAGGQAYKDRWLDVLQLVATFRKNWNVVSGKTPVTLEVLDRAETAANALATKSGEKEQAQKGTSPTALLRGQTFTLLHRKYDDVRRMLAYARFHEGDAEKIAPSFYAGRSRPQDAPEIAPPSANPIPPGMPGASPFATNPST